MSQCFHFPNAKVLPDWFKQTKKECEHLINTAKPSMQKSSVVDSETGKSKDSRLDFLFSTENSLASALQV